MPFGEGESMARSNEVIDLKVKFDLTDNEVSKAITDMDVAFKKAKPAVEKANNMVNRFVETLRKIDSTEGPDKLTKRLYKTEKAASKVAEKIQKLYADMTKPLGENKALGGTYNALDISNRIQEVYKEFGSAKALEDMVNSAEAEFKRLSKLRDDAIEGFKAYEQNITKDLRKTNYEITKIGKEKKALLRSGVAEDDPQIKALDSQLQLARIHLSEVRAAFFKLDDSMQSKRVIEMGNAASEAGEKFQELNKILTSLKLLLGASTDAPILKDPAQLQALLKQLESYEQDLNLIEKGYKASEKASKESANASARYHSSASHYARNHKSVLQSLYSVVKKLISGFKKLSLHTHKAFDSSQNDIKHALRNIMRYGLGVRSLYFLFRRLRAAIKDAFGVMAQQWEPVNQQISAMIKALNGVKGSLATMLQPLLEGFSTIFVQISAGIQKVMETIGAFFAYLTGQDYILRAKAGDVDWAEYLEDKLGEAADDAKELNKQLAGFDKLNNLTTNKSKDKQDKEKIDLSTITFEKVPIEKLDLFQWLKEMWEKSDFSEFGAMLNKKLLDMLQKLDWKKIEAIGRKIGKCIATAINGFFHDHALGIEIGKAIAGWLNTKFAAIGEFAKTVDWRNIGLFIVDGIKSFFDTANFAEWGDAAASLIDGLLEALYAIVSDDSMWEKATTKILEGLNGFMTRMLTKSKRFVGFGIAHEPIYQEEALNGFEKIGAILNTIANKVLDTLIAIFDDEELRQKFTEGVQTFIESIQWKDITFKLVDFGGAFIGSMIQALFGMENSEDADRLGKTAIWILIGAKTIQTAMKIFSWCAETWAKIKVFMEGIVTFLEGGWIAIQTAFLGFVGYFGQNPEALTMAIDNFSRLCAFVEDKLPKLADTISSFVEKAEKVVEPFFDFIGLIIEAIGLPLSLLGGKEGWQDAWDEFLTNIDKFKGYFNSGNEDVEIGEDLMNGLLAGAQTGATAGKNAWDAVFNGIIDEARDIFDTHSPSKVFEDIGIDVMDGFLLPFDKLKDRFLKIWDVVKTSAVNAIKIMSKLITSMLSTMSNNIKSIVSNMANSIVNAFASMVNRVKTKLSGIFSSGLNVSGIMDSFSSALADAEKNWSSMWSDMAKIAKNKTNDIIKYLNGILEGYGIMINTDLVKAVDDKTKNPTKKVVLPSIPYLAQGAVIPPNSQFLAVLGDQKSGTNVEAPLTTIEQALRNVLGEFGVNVTFDVKGDPNGMFKVMQEESRKFTRRTGLKAFT